MRDQDIGIESQSRSTISLSLRFPLELEHANKPIVLGTRMLQRHLTWRTDSSFESHEAKFYPKSLVIFICLFNISSENFIKWRVIIKRKFLKIGHAASCAELIQDRRSFTLFVSKIETILYLVSWTYISRASDDFKRFESKESTSCVFD